jgi:hypothetical protein
MIRYLCCAAVLDLKEIRHPTTNCLFAKPTLTFSMHLRKLRRDAQMQLFYQALLPFQNLSCIFPKCYQERKSRNQVCKKLKWVRTRSRVESRGCSTCANLNTLTDVIRAMKLRNLVFAAATIFISSIKYTQASALTTAIGPNARLCFYAEVDKPKEKIGVCFIQLCAYANFSHSRCCVWLTVLLCCKYAGQLAKR